MSDPVQQQLIFASEITLKIGLFATTQLAICDCESGSLVCGIESAQDRLINAEAYDWSNTAKPPLKILVEMRQFWIAQCTVNDVSEH